MRGKLSSEQAVHRGRRIGAADGTPQDVVQLIVVVQIGLAEIQPRGAGGGGLVGGIAIFERNALLFGLIGRQYRVL